LNEKKFKIHSNSTEQENDYDPTKTIPAVSITVYRIETVVIWVVAIKSTTMLNIVVVEIVHSSIYAGKGSCREKNWPRKKFRSSTFPFMVVILDPRKGKMHRIVAKLAYANIRIPPTPTHLTTHLPHLTIPHHRPPSAAIRSGWYGLCGVASGRTISSPVSQQGTAADPLSGIVPCGQLLE
jgi:hypothetical protein